jgi:hypothetical protein
MIPRKVIRNLLQFRGQPRRVGPPPWVLGEVLTIPLHKKQLLRIALCSVMAIIMHGAGRTSLSLTMFLSI